MFQLSLAQFDFFVSVAQIQILNVFSWTTSILQKSISFIGTLIHLCIYLYIKRQGEAVYRNCQLQTLKPNYSVQGNNGNDWAEIQIAYK